MKRLFLGLVSVFFVVIMTTTGCGSGGSIEEFTPPTSNSGLQMNTDVAEIFSQALNETGYNDINVQQIREAEDQLVPAGMANTYNVLSVVENDPEGLSEAIEVPVAALFDARNLAHLDIIESAQDEALISEEQKQFLLAHSLSANFIYYNSIIADAIEVPVSAIDGLRFSDDTLRDLIINEGLDPVDVHSRVREELVRLIQEQVDILEISTIDVNGLVTCLKGFEWLIDPDPSADISPNEIVQLESAYGIQLPYDGACFGSTIDIEPIEIDPENCPTCESTGPRPPSSINIGVGDPSSPREAPPLDYESGPDGTCTATFLTAFPYGYAEKLNTEDKDYKTKRQSRMDWCTARNLPKTEVAVIDGSFSLIQFYIETNQVCGKQDGETAVRSVQDVNKGEIVIYCGVPVQIHASPPNGGHSITTYPANPLTH